MRELVEFLRGGNAGDGEAVHVGRVVRSGMLNLVSNVLVSEDVADLSSDVRRVPIAPPSLLARQGKSPISYDPRGHRQ